MSYHKFTKDIWIIGVTNVIIVLRSLVLLPIITKILGPDSYGIWVQIIAALPFISLLATLGLPYAMVRFLAGEKDNKQFSDGFFSVITVVSAIILALAILIFSLSSQFSLLLGWPETIIKILAALFLFECINFVFLHVFRTLQKINLYSIFTILQSLGEIVFAVVAILLGYGLVGAVIGLLLVRVFCFLISGLIILKQIRLQSPKFLKMREYLKFGLPTIPGNISNWFVGFSDRYLIGYFLGLTFVGYYAPACTLGAAAGFLGAPFSFLLPAAISKLHDEDNLEDVKRYFKYSLKYFLAIAIPSFFGLSILAKKILLMLSTGDIASQGYLLVPFTALGMLLYSVYGIVYLVLILYKKTSLIGKIWVTAAVLNIALNFLLIPRFGIFIAALNSSLTYAFILVLTWICANKYLKIEIDWSFILKSLLASILMSFFVILANPSGIVNLILTIFVGTIIYFAILLLLKSFKKSEVNFFTSFLKK